jgi:hypothetical protein
MDKMDQYHKCKTKGYCGRDFRSQDKTDFEDLEDLERKPVLKDSE